MASITLSTSAISIATASALFYKGDAALSSLAATAVGYSGISAAPTLDTFAASLTFTGHPEANNVFDGALPMPTLAAQAGANAAMALASVGTSVSATGTVVNMGTAALTSLAGTVSMSGTFIANGSAALTLTPGGMSVTGYFGAVTSITLGSVGTVTASGTGTGSGAGAVTLPLYVLTATGHEENHGGANLTSPTPGLGVTGRGALAMPTGILVAIGHATVAAAYEAYAVNLNHIPRPRVDPVDEVTHYTNYPFDKIVRYKDHYYGVNSTGMYLLEGPTDTATAIAWTVQSAETDFGSIQQKTVESAYFGGRMAAASTINLFAGEGAVQPYAYTTPRGELAQNYRQTFGRGIKARYFSFGFAGSGTLDIDSVTLNVTTLSRRV